MATNNCVLLAAKPTSISIESHPIVVKDIRLQVVQIIDTMYR